MPQISVMGPLLFTLNTHPLSTVIRQSGLSYHLFASQSNVPSDFPVLACCLKDCIEDVAEWMGDRKLKINDNKTELMAIGTRSKLSQIIPNLAPMSISGCDIQHLSLLDTLVFTEMKRCPWMHRVNTCAAFCSVIGAELEKFAPSCQVMLPSNLLFLLFSLA